jgi:hypothetical protein
MARERYGLERPNYSASEIFRKLALGWRVGYRLIHEGALPAAKVGNKLIVASSDAARLLHSRQVVPPLASPAPEAAPRRGRPRRATSTIGRVREKPSF